jgi:hypothetical protein
MENHTLQFWLESMEGNTKKVHTIKVWRKVLKEKAVLTNLNSLKLLEKDTLYVLISYKLECSSLTFLSSLVKCL